VTIPHHGGGFKKSYVKINKTLSHHGGGFHSIPHGGGFKPSIPP